MDRKRLEYLKSKVFEMNNEHCFIERERFLSSISEEKEKSFDYYAKLFSALLDNVSTPVDEQDYFVGRVVEDYPEGNAICPNRILFAKGHLTPDYHRLLYCGYRGVL